MRKLKQLLDPMFGFFAMVLAFIVAHYAFFGLVNIFHWVCR